MHISFFPKRKIEDGRLADIYHITERSSPYVCLYVSVCTDVDIAFIVCHDVEEVRRWSESSEGLRAKGNRIPAGASALNIRGLN